MNRIEVMHRLGRVLRCPLSHPIGPICRHLRQRKVTPQLRQSLRRREKQILKQTSSPPVHNEQRCRLNSHPAARSWTGVLPRLSTTS